MIGDLAVSGGIAELCPGCGRQRRELFWVGQFWKFDNALNEAVTRMAKKLKPQQEREVIPRWRSLIGFVTPC
jgi:hypothetical protein